MFFISKNKLHWANYAHDTDPYAYNLNMGKYINSNEKNGDKFFKWFSDNQTEISMSFLKQIW